MATCSSAAPRRRAQFLLCGDSLTEQGSLVANGGWVALLQQAHVRSVDVLNRGLSGYTTRWFREYALPALREELEGSSSPSLITLWFGANDAAVADGPSQKQHVPLDEFKANLVEIVHEFQRLAPEAKLLVITPPVIDEDRRRRVRAEKYGAGPNDPLDRTNEHTGEYARACVETIGTLERVAVLDMHTFLMTQYPDPLERGKLLSDGLHFSREGNRVAFTEIQRVIRTLLPKERVDTWQLPEWTKL